MRIDELKAVREALSLANRDIVEWLQLGKRWREQSANYSHDPLCPTDLGMARSDVARESIALAQVLVEKDLAALEAAASEAGHPPDDGETVEPLPHTFWPDHKYQCSSCLQAINAHELKKPCPARNGEKRPDGDHHLKMERPAPVVLPELPAEIDQALRCSGCDEFLIHAFHLLLSEVDKRARAIAREQLSKAHLVQRAGAPECAPWQRTANMRIVPGGRDE